MANMLNLSKTESDNLLDLRKQNLTLCLEKKHLLDTKARVALVLDYSGSMDNLYRRGIVQAAIERILPIAMNFDDNGSMEMWLFSDGFKRLPDISRDNYYDYVKREIRGSMGGTKYAPVMNDIAEKYTREDPAPIADYIIFITDGDALDPENARHAVIMNSYLPIFWQFVGIGHAHFRFLEELDDMDGRYVDNANLFPLPDIMNISDDEIYDRLLAEFPTWLKNPKVVDMIQNHYNGDLKPRNSSGEKKGFFSRLFG